MTSDQQQRSPVRFFVLFGVVALVIAGMLSYLASSSPDGLDSVTRQGCAVTEQGGAEQLSGDCIAQHAQEHNMADSPLADYTVGGNDSLLGISGVIGVLATLAVAGGLFWLARPRRKDPHRVKDPHQVDEGRSEAHAPGEA